MVTVVGCFENVPKSCSSSFFRLICLLPEVGRATIMIDVKEKPFWKYSVTCSRISYYSSSSTDFGFTKPIDPNAKNRPLSIVKNCFYSFLNCSETVAEKNIITTT